MLTPYSQKFPMIHFPISCTKFCEKMVLIPTKLMGFLLIHLEMCEILLPLEIRKNQGHSPRKIKGPASCLRCLICSRSGKIVVPWAKDILMNKYVQQALDTLQPTSALSQITTTNKKANCLNKHLLCFGQIKSCEEIKSLKR